ncbi:hypothetical protein NM688_g4527 [Phlebia brevispora]|uniref:Uncharacterized protein n=1 Tax=Phlebia brevispora TaxID=194682 RepID=A0ACC1T2T9_9APHY|nr:hypothetical protein NM688_g4527 [Phlebia brevispora]
MIDVRKGRQFSFMEPISEIPNSSGTPGIPPPPPPPPSAFRFPRAQVKKPTKRLKPFFWTKLSAGTTTQTVWDELASDVAIDLDDLEPTFAMDSSSISSSQISLTSPKKPGVTTLLDITRSQNIAIMLARVKVDLPGIRKALVEVDDEVFSVDELKAIGKQLPTAEEVTRIKDFGDVSKLAKADQYFSQIMTIPRLSERLECLIYRRKLEVEIEEIRPELNIVRNASQELRASLRLRKVLQASDIYFRDFSKLTPVTDGIDGRQRLERVYISWWRERLPIEFPYKGLWTSELDKERTLTFVQLKETKTAKGGNDCPTLLHYLARVLLRSDPSLVMFIEDLPHLEAAARVSVQTVIASVQSLVTGLSQLREETEKLKGISLLPNDRFISVMQPFVQQVSGNVDALNNMAISLDTQLASLLTFFGEKPDSPEAPKPEDFFGLILTFSTSLQKAALEVHDATPVAQQQVAQVQVQVEGPSTPTQESTIKFSEGTVHHLLQPSSQGRASGLSLGRGDLDQAIRSMRDGRRRARPHRPASKIFVDGARASRIYD